MALILHVLFCEIIIYLYIISSKAISIDYYKQIKDMYTFRNDNIEGKEDGFHYKTQFSGPDTDISMDGYVNRSFLGVVDPISKCKCTVYYNDPYTICYDPGFCIYFPTNYKFSTNKLKISATNIRVLKKNDLGFLNSHLVNFMISGNHEFAEIEPGAFYNMSQLRNISLSHNPKLKQLHPESFVGCDNMDVLDLIENGFIRFLDFTQALSSRIVPNLRKIRIAKESIVNITREDFDIMNGTRLRILNINDCNVSKIDPDILIPLRNLTVLQLIDNNLLDINLLNVINRIASTNMTLERFSLSGYRHLPVQSLKAIANTKISHLSLCCSNKIAVIVDFPFMPHLKYLDLADVSATNVTKGAFNALPKLKTLLLNKNKLYEGSIWNAIRSRQLENLDISDNTKFEDYLLNLYPRVFANTPNLKYLNISLNNIRIIEFGYFAGLSKLKVLDLENCKILTVQKNSFIELTSLEYLDVSKNTFPNRIVEPDTFNGLHNLKVLLLNGCAITKLYESKNIFEKFQNLQYLSLSDNALKFLGPTLFKPLANLVYIDLARNQLKKWDIRIFLYNFNLKIINLQDNMLGTFTNAMAEDFNNLEELNIMVNRYACTCSEFKNITNTITPKLLRLLQNQPPLCIAPESYVNTPITDYLMEINSTGCNNFAVIIEENIAVYIIPSGIIVTIFVSILIAIYFYRCHIRYWFFLAKLALSGSGTYLKERFQNKRLYKYDAFISYCNEDHVFVRRLIYMLEEHEPYLKLCVYDRDFKIGTVISESVLESIGDSRRTLLVISDSYIKSHWCRWEVQVAENHRMFFEDEYGKCVNDTLVMIKVDDISSSTIVSPMLKYLMKTRIYLKWEKDYKKQMIFWKKLRRALKPPNKIARKV